MVVSSARYVDVSFPPSFLFVYSLNMLLRRDGLTETHVLGVRDLGIEAAFLVIATLALGLRLWARRISQRQLRFNDHTILVAWVRLLGQAVRSASSRGQH